MGKLSMHVYYIVIHLTCDNVTGLSPFEFWMKYNTIKQPKHTWQTSGPMVIKHWSEFLYSYLKIANQNSVLISSPC